MNQPSHNSGLPTIIKTEFMMIYISWFKISRKKKKTKFTSSYIFLYSSTIK